MKYLPLWAAIFVLQIFTQPIRLCCLHEERLTGLRGLCGFCVYADHSAPLQLSVFMATQCYPGSAKEMGNQEKNESHWLGWEDPGTG